MTERQVRLIIRGVVVAGLAPLAVAGFIANAILGHGSGTYIAIVTFLVIAGAGGGLAWIRPQPRTLVVWAAVTWIATLIPQMFGDPYRHERELAAWPYFVGAQSIGLAVVLFGAPLVAIAIRERLRCMARAAGGEPALAKRLRRVVGLAALLAGLGICVGFLPTSPHAVTVGMAVGVYVALSLNPGVAVYRNPTPSSAWMWTCLCAPFAVLGLLVTHLYGEAHWQLWLLRVTLGTLFALVIVVMPCVVLVTRDREAALPTARLR